MARPLSQRSANTPAAAATPQARISGRSQGSQPAERLSSA